MAFVIQRKSDKLFYNGNIYKWGSIEKARIFKKQGDITSYLRCCDRQLCHFTKDKFGYDRIHFTPESNWEVVEIIHSVKNEN